MPSPFPGMDPYLEAPDIWPDFHKRFAIQVSGMLNDSLPASYYARLEISNFKDAASEPIRHSFVEIRDLSRGHELVTLIEIVSPSNKQPGPDRRAYLRKQQETLESDASLIELDLLRAGERLLAARELELFIEQMTPRPDYLALVNRAWRRQAPTLAYQVFPIVVTAALPCIGVPLRQGEQEMPLDLQYAFQTAYDNGPYRRGAVDYRSPPRPALPPELQDWLRERLAADGPSRP